MIERKDPIFDLDEEIARMGDVTIPPRDLDALGKKPRTVYKESPTPWIILAACILALACQAYFHREDTARAIAKAKAEEHAQMVYAIKHFYKIDGIQVVAWYQGKKGK